MVEDTRSTGDGPETPRPGRSFQGGGHPADDRPISDRAARIGPPIVAVTLVLTLALLAWMAVAPTAIEGTIDEAPFAVPATLLLLDDGCVSLVDGAGVVTTYCDSAWDDRDDRGYAEAYFDDGGRVLVGRHPVLSVLDPNTGEVVDSVDLRDTEVGAPSRTSRPGRQVYGHGDRVLLDDDPDSFDWDPDQDEVLLDLRGPWGYEVTDAVLSPDGEWVLARTNRSQVVVAPADGSQPPYEWVDVPEDRWIDLWTRVHWDP